LYSYGIKSFIKTSKVLPAIPSMGVKVLEGNVF
jgi:hypothetical protein